MDILLTIGEVAAGVVVGGLVLWGLYILAWALAPHS
jgi:hypothetical protein